MSDSLSYFFGARKARKARKTRKARRSPGRKAKHGVKKLLKSQAYVTVAGRKRKLYLGKNGGLYYRGRSGRHYVPAKVLKRKKHMLSPKRARRKTKRKAKRKAKKGRRGLRKKLLQTKAAKARRRAYRKAHPKKY
jgi:hypothetical protein